MDSTETLHVVDNLLENRAAAEAGVDKLARSLALAEPRDRYLLRDRRVGLVDFLVRLSERNVDGELAIASDGDMKTAIEEGKLIVLVVVELGQLVAILDVNVLDGVNRRSANCPYMSPSSAS